MNRSSIRSNTVRAAVLVLVASVSGCSAKYATDNNSLVDFLIVAVNNGDALPSDVLVTTDTTSTVLADKVPVVVAVRFKNLNIPTVPSVPSAIIVERYEIKYRRSDGRGVEGQDVPYAISGNLTIAADVTRDENTSIPLEVVRAQAKLEPPLRNLVSGGGAMIVTMFADITLYARTISGAPVTARGSLQIDFADYGN